MMLHTKKVLFGLAFWLLLWGSHARAGFIINVSQDGPNVVANGVGTINISALAYDGTAPLEAFEYPYLAAVVLAVQRG